MTNETKHAWTEADLPDQSGRTAIVTGANTGVGFATAQILAEHGATVVLACRDLNRGGAAKDRILQAQPKAHIAVVRLDLASLKSIRAAADEIRAEYPRIDLLINNAGVMMPPYRKTEDNFELQFGTNHLGHFAFTGLLLDRLTGTPDSRIVTVASAGHRTGRIDFDDLQWERRHYRRIPSYGQSKLANLLFAYELHHRLADSRSATISLAAHPGGSDTELQRHSPAFVRFVNRFLPHQSARMGAFPPLYAATAPNVQGAEYYGPDGRGEFTGYPVLVTSNRRSHDRETQRRLWTVSERLTGVTYDFADLPIPRTG